MDISINKFLLALLLGLTVAACNSSGEDGGSVAASGVSVDRHDSGDDDDEQSTNQNVDVNDISATHQVLAFNDLGMHCADLDYSTFVILPPYNVIHSHVIERGDKPRILDDTEASVSYRAVQDASGSINSTSQNLPGSVNKSNFWDVNPQTGNRYAFDLFGLDPAPGEGLAFGQKMPGQRQPFSANDLQPFNHYDPDKQWFAADGVPILPIDDAGQLNAYPLMRVSASVAGSGNQQVASLDVVLPVASEADCQNCHALGEVAAPTDSPIDFVFAGDINDPNSVLQAAKLNILRLHDAKHNTDLENQTPVLCASCHYSAALDLAGTGPQGAQVNLAKMSEVMHGHHGELTDPASGEALFPTNGTLEETCYQCHPGKVTQCLRGAMGGAGIDCVDCHGSMAAVGSASREPWFDEPRCESCHTGDAVSHLGDSVRLPQAWEGDVDVATPRIAANKRFAENAGELYRNSLGHGGVACEGCHGSTHAIWPNAMPSSNDNVAATQLQGHAGTISECSTCHTSLPLTLDGPHGMHNVNSREWNLEHEEFYEENPAACQSCHGVNLEGTVLSMTAADRELLRDDDAGADQNITLVKGTAVSCDLCHEKPKQ
jgi:hypothetical protein